MKNKTPIECLDAILIEIKDITNFNVHRILSEHLNYNFDNETDENRHYFNELGGTVSRLGITYGYFETFNNSNPTALRLTDKGIKAKEVGGHFKYEKHLKKSPLNTYQKIYLSFFVIFGLFGIYKVFQPTVDISDFQKLKTDFEALNSRFDSIVKLTSKSIMQKSNDTLQAKNSDDLNKND